jgi:mannose-6-phosphate isomerase-like protein (cupin superfamily)
MLISVLLGLMATAMFSAPPVFAIDKPVNPGLRARLRMSLSHLDFWNSLSNEDMVFDFNSVNPHPFQPGSVLNANALTWPLLEGGIQAVAELNLGPCAMLAPHIHPRATNVVICVSGAVHTSMRVENGAMDRKTYLTPGKMTIFPRASFHTMVNEGKQPPFLPPFYLPTLKLLPPSKSTHQTPKKKLSLNFSRLFSMHQRPPLLLPRPLGPRNPQYRPSLLVRRASNRTPSDAYARPEGPGLECHWIPDPGGGNGESGRV